jgi:tetratricopeptide (TPR) repeat protein
MRLLVGLLVAGVAAAEPLESDRDSLARAHFITGQSYYAQGRYQNALTEFEEAYRLSERAAFVYNIGICHEKLGEADAAVAAYRRYLDSHPSDEDRRATEARIANLTAVPPEPPPAPPPRRDKPLYKRAWLWGVVAGGAVVIAGAVTLGVVLGTRDDTRTLQPLVPR